MSIPVSQFIPSLNPCFLPTLVTIVSFLHLWLYFYFINRFICTIFKKIPDVSGIYVCVCVSLWLTSLSMTICRYIHVAVYSLFKNPSPEATCDSVQRKLFHYFMHSRYWAPTKGGTPVVLVGGWDTTKNVWFLFIRRSCPPGREGHTL